jgi:hypothetical protein
VTSETTPIRGQVRLSGYRRVSHGLFLPVVDTATSADEIRRELHAWRLVMPDEAAYTHITAAWLHGWWLPQLPELVPVFAAAATPQRPRRAGLVYSRPVAPSEPALVHSLPVVPASEILLRAARDLGVFDLTILVESALRAGHVTMTDLHSITATGRPGVRPLRRAMAWANPKSESPYETLLRFFHELAGIAVQPQHEIFDARGQFVARGDLWVVGTRSIHEYDGAWHRHEDQQILDRQRERRFADTQYVRRGYVAKDMFEHPLLILQELDRVVGRPHHPDRIARWRRLLAESSYSVEGRRRLQNRWRRLT